jgi:hypothetical protein
VRVAEDLWVVGDVQGYLSALQRVLRDVGLVDADGRWSAGTATLVLVGDLVDRGPDGVGVIDFLMRLQTDAARHAGRVVVLMGNHDLLLLATRQFGEPFETDWRLSGGVQRDLDSLSDVQAAWLGGLPAVVVEQQVILLHADAMFYLDHGSTLVDVNAAFGDVTASRDPERWGLLLAEFTEHRAFIGTDGETNLDRYLGTFGGRQLVHGHTPVPRMLQAPPESVTAAYVYQAGRCVNVDPGIYLGGPGFAYRVTTPDISRSRP